MQKKPYLTPNSLRMHVQAREWSVVNDAPTESIALCMQDWGMMSWRRLSEIRCDLLPGSVKIAGHTSGG